MAIESEKITEILKTKALLLLRRERELFTLGAARERTLAWLQAFHRLSVEARPDLASPLCNEWATLMVRELHFQTAAAFRREPTTGEYHLIAGQSNSPVPERIRFRENVEGFLRARSEGLSNGSMEPALQAFAREIGLQRFLWSDLPAGASPELLLVTGFSQEVIDFHLPLSEEDLGYFRMLARHVSILLRSSRLIAELDRERRRLQVRNVQYAEANRELEAFGYSVSHDLRAPLRSIDGFSQALLEDYSDALDDQGRDYARRVRKAAQRMGTLIDDLLRLSKVSRAEIVRQRIDLSEMARSIVEELAAKEPERHVETVVEDGLVADADPQLTRVVLDNLLGNAWKFTHKVEGARIEVGAERGSEQLAYFVRDNGAGFDIKYAEKLFRPFQRLHTAEEFPGTGIGLATVHRIVDRHGGRTWARGEVGRGAAFLFTLPFVDPGGAP